MSTVERTENIVPARIWDKSLKGFRPMTAVERALITRERVNGYKVDTDLKQNIFRRMKPASERVQ